MGKYFGTDGIRGKANELLTAELALKVGQYFGHLHQGKKILIAQDTRRSSSLLSHALAAGASAYGADVYLLGVAPTPACAYLIEEEGFAGGVMVSASHNPFDDNGLKCFNAFGSKIDEDIEAEIEKYIDGLIDIEPAGSRSIGNIFHYESALETYMKHLENSFPCNLSGMKIVLDCAHGSAVTTAQRVFEDMGANLIVLHDQPDGLNINQGVGSTHMESLQKAVLELGADAGFAFDGDADRMLAVDENGEIVDGDAILFILGRHLSQTGHLQDGIVVSTVMANLGFIKSMHKIGLEVITTQVGDKYVFKHMNDHNHLLGGEQSGHIILKEYATTGDGVLSALALAQAMVETNQSLASLRADCAIYPQLLVNLPVVDKKAMMNFVQVTSKIEEISQALGDTGRILVRPSGTESLVRVMVEAETQDLCTFYVNDMIQVIKELEK